MRKKPFTIIGLALILGALAGLGTNFAIESRADSIMVVAEGLGAEEPTTEEERSRLQTLIDELQRKYNEIKDVQVAGTTIGAIAGAVVGAIVSAIPAIINRSNIKKALAAVAVCQENVRKVNDVLDTVQSKFGLVNDNYGKTIGIITQLSDELRTVKKSLEQAEKNYVALKEDNVALKNANEELRQITVLMVNHTAEYVANGTAEYINSKFKD